MTDLDTYHEQAKHLVRWHREGNYSIGGRLRKPARFHDLADRQALDMSFPLALAQEIIALDAGHPSWAALKTAGAAPGASRAAPPKLKLKLKLKASIPALFVRDVSAAAGF
jgi:hypothetical protein